MKILLKQGFLSLLLLISLVACSQNGAVDNSSDQNSTSSAMSIDNFSDTFDTATFLNFDSSTIVAYSSEVDHPEDEDFFNVRVFGGLDGHHVTGVKHVTKSGAIDTIEKDDFSNFILNADFGMGIDLWFLFVDAGYQIGLTPVYATANSAKASSFYANFGLRLRL